MDGMEEPKATRSSINSYSVGLKDGIPIGLGYLSVSFTFGMMAVNMGLPVWAAVLISVSNLTSAGQFAGISLITAAAPFVEMALTQLVINIRYALMSLSLSQKADSTMTTLHRLLCSFFVTDEIFAVASAKDTDFGRRYLYGLATAPFLGWTLGTLIGALFSTVMPQMLRSALGIAIYGMFIAIIIPPAKRDSSILKVLLIAIFTSCILRYLPVFASLSSGFSIILCALLAAGVGAWLFPVKEGS